MNEISQRLLHRVRTTAMCVLGCALVLVPNAAWATLAHELLEDSPTRTVLRLQWRGEERSSVLERSLAVAAPRPGSTSVSVRSLRAAPSGLESVVVEDASTPIARIEAAGRYRGQWIDRLIVRSHRLRGQSVERIEELIVEIRYDGSAEQLRPDPVRRATMDRAVINPAAARAYQPDLRPAGKLPPNVESSFDRSLHWMRFEVDRSGVYRIGYEDLAAEIGSAAASRILAESLRLWSAQHPAQPLGAVDLPASWDAQYTLSERAVELRSDDATLEPGDELLAYLPGPEDWSDRYAPATGRWKHYEHLYADRLAYWLSWDEAGESGDFPGLALRMEHVDGSPAGAGTIVDSHRGRIRVEQNDVEAHGRVPDDWAWEDNLRQDRDLQLSFELRSVVTDSLGVLVTELYGRRNATSTSETVLSEEFYFNRTPEQPADAVASWNFLEQENIVRAPVEFFQPGIALRDGVNTAVIRNASPTTTNTPRLVFDGLSLGYRGMLHPVNGSLEWVSFEDETVAGRWEYRLEEAGADWSDRLLLDTMDPFMPRVIDSAVIENNGASVRFGFDIQAATRHHFFAARRASFLRPLGFDARVPRLLRNEVEQAGQGWAMIVLYNGPAFQPAAEALASFRSNNLPGYSGAAPVTAVDVQDIYDLFGHGVKEPTAIRNYLKFVYEYDGQLAFVCIIGDASRDYRNRLPGASNDPFAPERDQVPTVVQTQFPYNPGASARHPYAADDRLVSFDAPALVFFEAIDLPDVAIGRLPAGNPVEASHLVNRVIAYESSPPEGSWRNTILMVADDEVGLQSGSETEAFHVQEAEQISEDFIDPSFNMDKLYLTEFPKVAGQPSKPASNQAMIERWSQGRLLIHYIGHGSPTQMADENVFSSKDIPALTNEDRLPLFLALSCDVAIFDSPNTKSMSEEMVLEDGGGALATIAATQVTFVSQNDRLTEALYPQLFPDGPGRGAPVGQALMLAKVNVPGSTNSVVTQHNNQKYCLLGDPSFRLQAPDSTATLAGAVSVEISSAQVQTLEGRIEEGGSLRTDLSGRYFVQIYESAEFAQHPLEGNPDFILEYRLNGSRFFQGTGEFEGGVASVDMISPADMRFGEFGRVEILMETDEGAYLGSSDDHPVRRAPVSGTDVEGPSIVLQFLNDAHRVSPGDVLTATLEDSSGINTLGSAQLNSILVELDDEALPFDVSSSLKMEEGSFSRGSLELPLPDSVDEGQHRLRLLASDMLGNRGSAEIEFEVVPAGRLDIAAHAAFPNPFRDSARFIVEVNAPDAVTIDLDIYTLDGRPLRHLQRRESGDGTYVLNWDGLDGQGGELANGTYLYAIRARFSGEQEIHQVRTGKIVRMR